MAVVEIRKLSKAFGREPAVRDLSLSVADGELMVLVGPSGCGKSTVLRCVAGLETPDQGDVIIAGRRVNDLPPRARDAAMVFQSYALYPHLTVAENLAFPLEMRRVPRDERQVRVAEVARVLELEEMLGRKPGTLSGGQMQRVALGRAMIRDPAVFLFDEPLSNLDVRMRLEMCTEIARLHQRLGTTMIYVTHDQAEAMTLGTRIAVLEEGRIQQVGPPLEVYHHPANRFVAGFIGTPPMNFVRGAGIRPHDIVVDPDGPLAAEVELVEPMGAETWVHCRVENETVLVVTKDPPDTKQLRLVFPPDKIHRFE